jgi:hypothetical protein
MISVPGVQGLPYETVNLGPPKPPCNDERVATIKALECTDGPPDPQLGAQIRDCCKHFFILHVL